MTLANLTPLFEQGLAEGQKVPNFVSEDGRVPLQLEDAGRKTLQVEDCTGFCLQRQEDDDSVPSGPERFALGAADDSDCSASEALHRLGVDKDVAPANSWHISPFGDVDDKSD
jgi:hypothetical protein